MEELASIIYAVLMTALLFVITAGLVTGVAWLVALYSGMLP